MTKSTEDDPKYITRAADREASELMQKFSNPIVIEGPFQVGKTLLLKQMMEQAKSQGQVVFLDFQSDFDEKVLSDGTNFYKSFFKQIGNQLELEDFTKNQDQWDPDDGNNSNGNTYMLEHILKNPILKDTDRQITIAVDETHRLFKYLFCNDFFGMLRGWEQKKVGDNDWSRLKFIFVIATSTNSFITDNNSSPFNIAKYVYLKDFDFEQLKELNTFYDIPIKEDDLKKLHERFSGHPYLTRAALDWLDSGIERDVEQLLADPTAVDGLFGKHLGDCRRIAERNPDLKEALKQILKGEESDFKDSYMLYRAGFVKETANGFEIRNELYKEFLEEWLVPNVVLLVHGIRTRGAWQAMVKKLEEEETIKEVIPVKYGYWRLSKFLFSTPSEPIDNVQRKLERARKKHPKSEISIIAQSFGSFIVEQILKENKNIKIKYLILCGSILPQDYPWENIEHQVKKVVNECGTSDIWPIFAQKINKSYGASGTHGFFDNTFVTNRFHKGGHGQYFKTKFIEKYWKPLIQEGKKVSSGCQEELCSEPWWISILGKK